MMVTAVLSVVAVSEPDPVEYVDIECQPAAISVDCNNVQLTPLKLKALHRSGADAALLVHQGVPITTVQKLLGHTSVRTTEVYSEVLSNTIIRDLKAVKRKKKTPDFSRVVECG